VGFEPTTRGLKVCLSTVHVVVPPLSASPWRDSSIHRLHQVARRSPAVAVVGAVKVHQINGPCDGWRKTKRHQVVASRSLSEMAVNG
jgi:hypothetical protein